MLYPPMGGEYLRNWQTIYILQQFGAVAVFSLFEREIHPPTIAGIEHWEHFNLAADSSIQSRREQLVQWFKQAGLMYYCPYRAGAVQALKRVIATFQPNLVILEQLWMVPYLPILQKYPCRIIYDAHNVEVPLYRTTKGDTRGEGWGIRTLVRNTLHLQRIQASEQTLICQADQVWVCSQQDQDQLHEQYGNFQSFVVPNGVDQAFYADISHQKSLLSADSETTHNVIFTGNFAHLPNAQAAEVLIAEIYPALKALYPQTRLLLVGRQATAYMQAAAQQDPHIVVPGEVPDIRPYLAIARTMVVPLTQGSGTRLKILEAFAAQCPVVSTAKGAEGLDVRDGKQLLIRNGSADLVQGALQLWTHPELALQLTDAAFQLVQSQYSWASVSCKVEQALQELVGIK
jgi:glycosyltransferase involved in cell wall biosynthesis